VKFKLIDLSSNKIKAIRDGAFKDLCNLETLLLDDNQLEYILKYTFQGLYNLKWLSLAKNRLTFINVKAFAHIKSLVLGEEGEFKLEENPIDRIKLKEGVVFFY
jgi:Leucine-rich repeat (LRR) protein